VVICPTQSHLTDINVWLKSPEMGSSLTDVFVDFGGGYLGLLPYGNTPSLEDATGTSLDTFYATYLDPNADACMGAQWGLGDLLP
jgi:predicted Zn-dependent peptidase